MRRRNFLKGLIVLGTCPACARLSYASSQSKTPHWTYSGDHGPEHWGELDRAYAACSTGHQQSPINIESFVRAEVEPLTVMWRKGGALMVNNGHTIQVNMPKGNTLSRLGESYELLQFHFHAPSEHKVNGMTYPMEMHFVHRHAETGGLAVVAIFVMPGMHHGVFSTLAEHFPRHEGDEVELTAFNPADLLPAKMEYWTYEGSLTTPPCSEIVSWMVVREPLQVEQASIQRFTAIYSGNARPVLGTNRRLILTN